MADLGSTKVFGDLTVVGDIRIGGASVIDTINAGDNTAVKLTGNQTVAGVKTFSSTITGSVSGNAATATKLETARTIAGVSFDGTANISLTAANVGAIATTGGTATGNITAPDFIQSSTQSTNTAACTRKDYVDSAIAAGDALQVSKTGDTMTGNLTTPKVLVSGAQGTEVNALTRKDYVDAELAKKLNLAGDTMTGNLTAPAVLVSAAQNTSVNALTRKDYVDSAIAAGAALRVSKTGDTMTGNLGMSGNAEIKFTAVSGGTGIAGGTGDGATQNITNLQIKSWFGIGISPTAGLPAGMTMGQNSIWINARNGGISAIGNITANKSLVSAAQGTEANALTRKDYVDEQVATRAPTTHTHTVAAITDLRPQDVSATANTLALRDGSADVHARLLRTTYQDESRMSGAIAFRVNNSTDNYTRYCSDPASVRDWMKGAKTDWQMGWRAYIEHTDNPMTEYHIPGKAAAITYLTQDGFYKIDSSSGTGVGTFARMSLDASGNLYATGGVHDMGQRVYSPNNPPPNTNSHNHTAAQANSNVIAGAQYAVGSYILAQKLTTSVNEYGDNVLGSSLIPASAGKIYWDGHTLSGTWKCMGYAYGASADVDQRTTLFIRIS